MSSQRAAAVSAGHRAQYNVSWICLLNKNETKLKSTSLAVYTEEHLDFPLPECKERYTHHFVACGHAIWPQIKVENVGESRGRGRAHEFTNWLAFKMGLPFQTLIPAEDLSRMTHTLSHK